MFSLEESNNELTELARRQFFLLHDELLVLDEKVKQADNEIQRGDTYIRTQLINGARSALRNASNKNDQERVGFNKACVALANKMARFAWAMVHNGQDYQVKP
ncbi:hypothetical transposase [Photobacterium profundum SS9]|uniref:Hypothetical transposase n=1 Tax=Photobacterium profundum (strain SS9) TaxID=298386 RepID=Q6LU23_PHOPR|nr:hypothetical transposase [Photobacterium profundum SS9]